MVDIPIREAADSESALVKPPSSLFALAALFASVSVALFAGNSSFAHWVGYVLGSFLTIFTVALFRRTDAGRSSSPLYSPEPWLSTATLIVLAVGLISAIGHIYYLAQQVVT